MRHGRRLTTIGMTALSFQPPGLSLASLTCQEFFSRDSLKHSMARVEKQGGRVKVSKKSRAEIETETGGPKILALRGAVIAFVKNGRSGHKGETNLDEGDECLEEIEARFHGAEVVKKLDDLRLTHVVIVGEEWKKEEIGMANVRKERSKRLRVGKTVFHLVSAAWMEASVRENRMVLEGEYVL